MNMRRYFINFKYAFNIKKPILLIRIIKNYFKLMIGQVPLRYIDIALTYNCNLKCEHCSALKLVKKEKLLTINEYKDLAKECIKMGTITVGFTGGEPTLYPNLNEIIKVFYPNKMMISLITDGVGISEERIKEFKKVGVDILCVSIDSLNAKIHDKFRGLKGALSQSLNTIKIAKKYGFKIVIATVLTHQNVKSKEVEDIIEFTKKNKFLLVFNLAAPAGEWSSNMEVMLSKNDIKYLNNLIKKNPHIRRDFGSNYLTEGCGGGNEKLYFTPYGDVIPCPFVHISFGNIRKDNLGEIQKRILKIGCFEGYSQECYAAENREYIKKYLSKTFKKKELPMDYKKVFK